MYAIQFTLIGRMAHFRRPWTNSAASTYWMPPPSTLRGIIGAAMGWPPKELAERTDSLHLGVELLTPIHTVMQTVNHLKEFAKKGSPGARGGWVRTQTGIEIIRANAPECRVRYRITIAGTEETTMQEISEKIQAPIFPLSLGPAYCLGWATDIIGPRKVTISESFSGELHGMIPLNGSDSVSVMTGGASRVERMANFVTPARSALSTTEFLVHDGPTRCTGRVKASVTIDGHAIALF